ncbi:permease, partial [Vibrio parahaemolyticus]|nr:permease [Vibrio parahaemolyticus]
SPLVDLASVILLGSIFNLKIAIAYVFVGVILAIIGGSIIDKLKMQKYVEDFVFSSNQLGEDIEKLNFKDRLDFSKNQVIDIVNRVWKYVLIGVFIGSMIHN